MTASARRREGHTNDGKDRNQARPAERDDRLAQRSRQDGSAIQGGVTAAYLAGQVHAQRDDAVQYVSRHLALRSRQRAADGYAIGPGWTAARWTTGRDRAVQGGWQAQGRVDADDRRHPRQGAPLRVAEKLG